MSHAVIAPELFFENLLMPQYPAITGSELAEAFAAWLGRGVVYQATSPDEFRAALAPMLGDGPAAAPPVPLVRVVSTGHGSGAC